MVDSGGRSLTSIGNLALRSWRSERSGLRARDSDACYDRNIVRPALSGRTLAWNGADTVATITSPENVCTTTRQFTEITNPHHLFSLRSSITPCNDAFKDVSSPP